MYIDIIATIVAYTEQTINLIQFIYRVPQTYTTFKSFIFNVINLKNIHFSIIISFTKVDYILGN